MRALVACLLAAVLLAACASEPSPDDEDAAAPTAPADDDSSATTSGTPGGLGFADAQCDDVVPDDPRVTCGVLTVPADRQQPDGPVVTIPVAIVRSADPDPLSDPIIYFSGGPGFPGRTAARRFLTDEELAGPRDVIVFDQRGTGASKPSLDCPETTEAVWAALAGAGTPAEEAALVGTALDECRRRLLDEGVVLDAYDTPTTAADVEDLRLALGISQWNLLGVSYGTTVALEVLRQHPGSVRSVVLDSAYPPDVASDAERVVTSAGRAVATLAAGCSADPRCSSAHGDVAQTLAQVAAAWDAHPFRTTVDDPETADPREVSVAGGDLVAGLWNAMYDSGLIGTLPSLLDPLLRRDPVVELVLGQVVERGVDQLTAAADGVLVGVDCADRQRLAAPSSAVDLAAAQPLFATLLTLGAAGACARWDVPSVPGGFNTVPPTDVPVLVLAGEYDPVTPPGDGERTAAALGTSARFVLLPGLGHAVAFEDNCAASLLASFVADPLARLDTGCVRDLDGPRWVT